MPNVPVAKACARNSARSPSGLEEPGNASRLAEEPEHPGERSREPRRDERFGGRSFPCGPSRGVRLRRAGEARRRGRGAGGPPLPPRQPGPRRARGAGRFSRRSPARLAAASAAREARKKAVEGESEKARPPFTQTTGRNAAKVVPPSAAHPPTSLRPQRKSADSETQESRVAATVNARKGDGTTGRSARPIRIQTGNPGAWGERSYRSKRVTAPAKTASSISPGETAIARKRVATTAPRSAATSRKGGSPGRGCGGRDIGKRHSRGVGDRSPSARGSGGKHGARGARMGRCF